MHYLVFSCKTELDQLKQGLAKLLEILNLVQNHPVLFKPLFVAHGKPKLSADSLTAIFHMCWSPKGSNQWENEEAVILEWTEYLQGTEGKLGVWMYWKICMIMYNTVQNMWIMMCVYVHVMFTDS